MTMTYIIQWLVWRIIQASISGSWRRNVACVMYCGVSCGAVPLTRVEGVEVCRRGPFSDDVVCVIA